METIIKLLCEIKQENRELKEEIKQLKLKIK